MAHWHDRKMRWRTRAGYFDKHNNIVFLRGAGIEIGFVAHHMGDYNGRGIKMILDGGVSLVGNWIAYIQRQYCAILSGCSGRSYFSTLLHNVSETLNKVNLIS